MNVAGVPAVVVWFWGEIEAVRTGLTIKVIVQVLVRTPPVPVTVSV